VKLGLTSLDLLAIVKELQLALISARIDNVYQLQNGSFLVRFRGREGYSNLIVDLPRRLNLTSYKFTVPERPTPQAAQLRRLLNARKVEGVCQVDFDRILKLDLGGGEDALHLYIELFGDGNVIVADAKGTIKYALLRKEMRDRSLKINLPYLPPPQRGADIGSDPPFEAIASQRVASVRALTRAFNIPPELAEEGLQRASIDPVMPADALGRSAIELFLDKVRSLVEDVRALKIQPNQVLQEGKPFSFYPVYFRSAQGKRKDFPSFNEAVDDYFSSLTAEESEEKRRSPAEGAISNLQAILERQRLHIADLEEKRKEAGEEGRLIIAHLRETQGVIDLIRSHRRAGEGWDGIGESLAKFGASGVDPARASVKIKLEGRVVGIDFRESATANAEKRFKESKEAAKKLEGLAKALKETEAKIQKARDGLTRVSRQIVLKAMKKEWYEKFRWFRTSDGLLVIGGRDSTQNEILVKKHLDPRDLFAHGDVPGGSVVVIKSESGEITEGSKREAVSFAVSYSRAWGAGLAAADGYWVQPEQVSKTPPSGEYLGKGAFMIYGTKNFVRNAHIQIYLGVEFSEGAYRVRVSIDPAPLGQSSPVVRLTPGDLEGQGLIKKMKELLALRAGDNSGSVNAIPPQDIESLLPRGGCSVS
jgi:predicted ribosome quality control (RQC) complex YloA/Tae2 family protein